MKKDLTELVFILDRSDSMSGLEKDTIGGFNSMIEKQKELPGKCILTTVLFDHDFELLHDRMNLKGAPFLTSEDYYVRGSTALLDAVGKAIEKIANAQKRILDSEKPEKTIFVITTDGMENASHEFNYPRIKRMITAKREAGWEFIFLGANLDAAKMADNIGISRNRATNYVSDSKGTKLNYKVMSDAVCEFRSANSISDSWKDEIEEDYELRNK
ncbi:MAG: VWA domain-containing protein [Clostridiaceae bacterium]